MQIRRRRCRALSARSERQDRAGRRADAETSRRRSHKTAGPSGRRVDARQQAQDRVRSQRVRQASEPKAARSCSDLLSLFYFGGLVLDHGLAPQSLKIALGLGAKLLLEHLIADFLHLRGLGFGLPLAAYREHLDSLGRLFRRRQVADGSTIEDLPQFLGEIRGKFRYLIAYRDVRKGAREGNALVAVLE